MKIFSNFDTALDQQLLNKETIILKKHPFFLLRSIFPFVFFLICYGSMMYLNQSQKGLMGIGIDVLFTCVFIFWFWKIASYVSHYLQNFRMVYYETDKPLLQSNDSHFDNFLKTSFFVIGVNIVISLWNLAWGIYLVISNKGEFSVDHAQEISLLLVSIVLNIGMILLQIQLFKKCIDLEMDFCACTEHKISYVDQISFLAKRISEVRYDKVTNISIDQKGILHSVFDYGNILIFTEGEDQQEKTMIEYVKSPVKVRNILNDLFEGKPILPKTSTTPDISLKTKAMDTRKQIGALTQIIR